ncbi:MAG TPA: cytochrome C oxidase subunit I [Burkholderiales bacterium]|nr:cytochrome C oxidase subunit I [Burkholderiales bacterium]
MQGPDTPAARRGRLKLLLIGAFFALPVAAAWVAWWLDLSPGATSNYGTLVAPSPVAIPAVRELKGRWVLVQFDGGACDAACERKLYIMRQIRRAQGGDMQRVERLWFVTDGVQPRARLLEAIAGTRVVFGAGADGAGFPPGEGSVKDHIYLVDPLGNLMMRFPRDPDPSRMIKDLHHLLQVSQFG